MIIIFILGLLVGFILGILFVIATEHLLSDGPIGYVEDHCGICEKHGSQCECGGNTNAEL